MLRELGLSVASSLDKGDLKRKRKLGDESSWAVEAAGTGVFDGVAWPAKPAALDGAVCAPSD
jgi:hypothetical protein